MRIRPIIHFSTNFELTRLFAMKASQSEVLFNQFGKDVFTFELVNDHGMKVSLSNYGGIVQSLIFPDRDGNFVDVVLGFDKIEDYLSADYLKNYPYFGAIIGRYANRISQAKFPVDGQLIHVSSNTPPHQLHGGVEGFDKKVWEVISVEEHPIPKVKLAYFSADGEEGFPGNVEITLIFELNNQNELSLKIEAVTDAATAINMCNHCYFNLNGDGSLIEDHLVEIPADYYLAQDADYVVTGELIATKNSTHDFLNPTPIGQNWIPGEGYDQAFVLNKPARTWGKAASAFSPKTGITLEVLTDQPGVQFYSGKYLEVQNGKNGVHYKPFTSFCFETQHHPNSVNIPSFAETILRPGEKYQSKTVFKLSCSNPSE